MEKLSVDQVCYQLNRQGIDKASIQVIRGKVANSSYTIYGSLLFHIRIYADIRGNAHF